MSLDVASLFCRECGTLLDRKTGLCPKCDAHVDAGGGEWTEEWIKKHYPDVKV